MAKLEVLPKRVDVLEVDSNDNKFRINIDILNECFGANRSMYCKACFPDKKGSFLYDNEGNKYIVWMPKLFGNSSLWKNSISEDGSIIKEVAEGDRNEDWLSEDKHEIDGGLRIVFVKDTPKSQYRFAGIFRSGDMSFCNHTYERVATKIELIGNPVTSVRLIK